MTEQYSKIENEQQYREYCDRLETLALLSSPVNIEIELLTALIEQYDDYCDMKAKLREILMRLRYAIPETDLDHMHLDQGMNEMDQRKLIIAAGIDILNTW